MPTFLKSERLCSTLAISHLFNKGYTLYKHPVKIKWLPVKTDNNHSVQVVISVSKSRFKRAVDRNRIKRLLRECFRLNKALLEKIPEGLQCHLALIYVGKDIPEMSELEPIIIELFNRLIREYENVAG